MALSGCASWPRRWSARPCCIDAKPIVRRQPIAWHLIDVTLFEPIEQPFRLVRPLRKLFGLPVRALNMQDGRVAGSAFFTDRDPAQLSVDDIRGGPTLPEETASPPFTVTKAKAEGKTAGFFITDARAQRFLFKLDPVESPELLSGAEVVTSKLLYALGYRVPSYEVLFVRPEELRLSPTLTVKSGSPQRHPFGQAEVEALLRERVQEGTVRVSASKILEGEILGPARFKRFRDCAEMRALKIAYAWLNNTDAKDHNSLLVWNGRETVGYLMDFGTALGANAGSGAPKRPCEGWLHDVDLKEGWLTLFTFGLHRAACDPQAYAISPSLGLFSPHVDPDRWKPYAPNLAFNEMNEDDARWIARRMARLSRTQIDAAVSAGRYSHPEDAAYLVDVLDQRRLAIIRHYLNGEP